MSRRVETDSARVKAPEETENEVNITIQVNGSEPSAVETNKEKISAVSEQVYKRKFVEKPNQIHDSFEYPRDGSDPGLLVVFNQEVFVTNDPRVGTKKDVEDLIVTLGRLGFNIHEEYIFHDLTRKGILDEIDKICNLDHSARNCLIVVFLTHGDEEDKLFAKDTELETKEIWKKFGECESLRNKPKLFIFQACKGGNKGTAFDDGSGKTKIEEDQFKIVPKDIFITPLVPHMLLVYASVEGNVSFRDPEQGTWFIQELCRNFLSYGRRDDVIGLIIRTSKCVATYDTTEEENTYKQMPTFISTLTKKFYLVKSKDRNITLAIKKKQDEILELLENLSVRVNALYETHNKRKNKSYGTE